MDVALVFCTGDCVVTLPDVALIVAGVAETAGFGMGIAGTTLPDLGPAGGALDGVLDAAAAGNDGAAGAFCVVAGRAVGAIGSGAEGFGSDGGGGWEEAGVTGLTGTLSPTGSSEVGFGTFAG